MSTDARATVLARVRAAVAGTAAVEVPRAYLREDPPMALEEVLDLLCDRLLDYRASVHRCAPADLAETVARALDGVTSVVTPAGLPDPVAAALGAPGRTVFVDGEPALLAAAQLDEVATVVTTCAVAIAETGTIVLDASAGQGRRALTLVPDHHVCVVRADQVVVGVPAALRRLDAVRPLTFVSGPSATSDIELQRVEGVHGPRNLEVVVVEG